MYELQFSKKAVKELKRLEKSVKERIWVKLQECKVDPFRFLKHLEQIKGYKLRVGDYRLIIDVDINNRILNMIKLGNRRNIYEK